MSSPEMDRPPRPPVCQVVRATRTVPTRSEISWLKCDVLAAAEHDQHVGEADQGAGFGFAEDRHELGARSGRRR